MAKFVDAATILEVKDVKASEAFYNEKLGFGPGFFYGDPPCFCIISAGRATILHHDQTFIFFLAMTAWALCVLVETKRPHYLFWLTGALFFTSLTRPAGNFLYPCIAVIALWLGPRNLKHWVISIVAFVSLMAGLSIRAPSNCRRPARGAELFRTADVLQFIPQCEPI